MENRLNRYDSLKDIPIDKLEETHLPEVIEYLKELYDAYKNKNYLKLYLTFGTDPWDESIKVELTGIRQETDEEYNKRIAYKEKALEDEKIRLEKRLAEVNKTLEERLTEIDKELGSV